MELWLWLVIAIIIGLILLRIFFKLAKWVIIVAVLVIAALWFWNTFVATSV
jgi:hypothetical protein